MQRDFNRVKDCTWSLRLLYTLLDNKCITCLKARQSPLMCQCTGTQLPPLLLAPSDEVGAGSIRQRKGLLTAVVRE